jgi:hypothetical protein
MKRNCSFEKFKRNDSLKKKSSKTGLDLYLTLNSWREFIVVVVLGREGGRSREKIVQEFVFVSSRSDILKLTRSVDDD